MKSQIIYLQFKMTQHVQAFHAKNETREEAVDRLVRDLAQNRLYLHRHYTIVG